MLKIGVIGAGHLGIIHIKCILQIPNYKLVGFYDNDSAVQKNISETYQLRSFNSADELLEAVDAVDIITPTTAHFYYASAAIRKLKHVFIEKPVVSLLKDAILLTNLSHEANVKVQVGHVERLNPAFVAVKPHISNPMFIECHRLALYNPRGTDVSVVLDLMIHDIDIVLSVVKSPIKKIHANGTAIVSSTIDIANARIEFENGAVANLTANRIAMKNMRKTRIFQQDAYISVDFLDKKAEVFHLVADTDSENISVMQFKTADDQLKYITKEAPEVKPTNAILSELESFYQSIVNDSAPLVSISDGSDALNVADKIMSSILNKS
jgi:predicted dehydrogenase